MGKIAAFILKAAGFYLGIGVLVTFLFIATYTRPMGQAAVIVYFGPLVWPLFIMLLIDQTVENVTESVEDWQRDRKWAAEREEEKASLPVRYRDLYSGMPNGYERYAVVRDGLAARDIPEDREIRSRVLRLAANAANPKIVPFSEIRRDTEPLLALSVPLAHRHAAAFIRLEWYRALRRNEALSGRAPTHPQENASFLRSIIDAFDAYFAGKGESPSGLGMADLLRDHALALEADADVGEKERERWRARALEAYRAVLHTSETPDEVLAALDAASALGRGGEGMETLQALKDSRMERRRRQTFPPAPAPLDANVPAIYEPDTMKFRELPTSLYRFVNACATSEEERIRATSLLLPSLVYIEDYGAWAESFPFWRMYYYEGYARSGDARWFSALDEMLLERYRDSGPHREFLLAERAKLTGDEAAVRVHLRKYERECRGGDNSDLNRRIPESLAEFAKWQEASLPARCF